MRPCPFCGAAIDDAAMICTNCRRDMTPADTASPAASARKKRRVPLLIVLGIVLVACAFVGYRARQGAGRGGIAALVMRPQTAQLANVDELDLAPGAIQRWEWVATAKQPTCRVTGLINVIDGGDRDVEVFVLTAANYDSLNRSRHALAFFQTPRTSNVKLDVTSSQAGRMVLAVSNRFSPQAAKVVQLRNVQVVCQ